MTGTTIQSRGYYNSFTGTGARTFSVTNPFTNGAVDGRSLRNFYTVDP